VRATGIGQHALSLAAIATRFALFAANFAAATGLCHLWTPFKVVYRALVGPRKVEGLCDGLDGSLTARPSRGSDLTQAP